MELQYTAPTINYPIVRLISPNEVWEMGIYLVLYGYRVGFGRVGSQIYLKGGYCAGSQLNNAIIILALLVDIFKPLDEQVTHEFAEKLLPDWKARPIPQSDPECMSALVSLAADSATFVGEKEYV